MEPRFTIRKNSATGGARIWNLYLAVLGLNPVYGEILQTVNLILCMSFRQLDMIKILNWLNDVTDSRHSFRDVSKFEKIFVCFYLFSCVFVIKSANNVW